MGRMKSLRTCMRQTQNKNGNKKYRLQRGNESEYGRSQAVGEIIWESGQIRRPASERERVKDGAFTYAPVFNNLRGLLVGPQLIFLVPNIHPTISHYVLQSHPSMAYHVEEEGGIESKGAERRERERKRKKKRNKKQG